MAETEIEPTQIDLDSPEGKAALEAANEIIHGAQADTFMDNATKQGVIMTLVTAILSDEKFQYRQTLRTASFQDNKQSRLAAGAISEAERYGAPLSPIINLIEAQNGERGPAGVRGMALEALTHFTFGGQQSYYRGKANKNGHDKNKPL